MRRRLSTDNYLHLHGANRISGNMVHVDNDDIQSIIEEDDKHHEELK